jgi:hypothetical protein
MTRSIHGTLAALAFGVTALAQAGTVVPAHDLTGTWRPAGGGTSSYFQEGTQLTFINISGGFAHSYNAHYISPTKAQGIQHRVDRATGCSTEMLLTLTASSADSVSISAKALDSSCDLVKGHVYIDTAVRVQ